jgi:hypothetical protein
MCACGGGGGVYRKRMRGAYPFNFTHSSTQSMATKNYKPTSSGNGKFFWQHFEKVDTDNDGEIDSSQFYTAIQNIMADKSIKGISITNFM